MSESINQKRWKKFKSIKRGYYSFILIIGLYILSFLLPLLINSKALIVQYEGDYYFPAFRDVTPGMTAYYDGNIFSYYDKFNDKIIDSKSKEIKIIKLQ